MPVMMKPLKTERDKEKYKMWLSSKSRHYLTCILGNFERDEKRAQPRYKNLPLRIELITKEIEYKRKQEEVSNIEKRKRVKGELRLSRWQLTDEVKEKFTPIVKEFINQVETIDRLSDTPLLTIDLSDTELNPYTLENLIKVLGYENTDHDSNGWQYDFWITMRKDGCKTLSIEGTGAIFELKLTEKERKENVGK